MLRVALLFALNASPVLAAWPEGVPGAEVGRMVRAAMQAAGADAPAFADPLRPYPACAADPVISPRGGSWATAELRCAAPLWVRAIRTGAEPVAQIAVGAPQADTGPAVVTLLRSVAKGAVIGAGDVGLAPMSARGVDGIFTDISAAVGRRARAHLGEGQPLLLRQLEPAWLVERGNPLSLTAAAGGLVVSAPAEALEDGQAGDIIRVLNLSSRREVKALVTGRNIVTAQTNMR